MNRILSAFFCMALLTPLRAADPKPNAEETFALRVLPTFKSRCFACHGQDPKEIKGSFDLTSRAALLPQSSKRNKSERIEDIA